MSIISIGAALKKYTVICVLVAKFLLIAIYLTQFCFCTLTIFLIIFEGLAGQNEGWIRREVGGEKEEEEINMIQHAFLFTFILSNNNQNADT